jgi:hypothetical protein
LHRSLFAELVLDVLVLVTAVVAVLGRLVPPLG